MDRREATRHKLHFLALLAEKVRAEMATDKPYQIMEFEDLSPDDALRQPSDRFCRNCGKASLPGADYCPSCGSPSKKLQAADPRAVEAGAAVSLPSGPTMVARLNVAGVTVEVFDDGLVVVVTPSVALPSTTRLGTDMLSAYETRLTSIQNVDAKRAAAPTSTIERTVL